MFNFKVYQKTIIRKLIRFVDKKNKIVIYLDSSIEIDKSLNGSF